MSLPIDHTFPQVPEFDSFEGVKEYEEDQKKEIQRMYENLSENINGSIRTDFENESEKWTPTISSSGTDGTIVYTSQFGFSRRSGIIVELWFDVSWTGIGAATGSLFLDLPYKTTSFLGNPFITPISTESITYSPSTTIALSADTDSYIAKVVSSGSGLSILDIPIQVGGISGNFKYIGVEDE